MLNPGPSLSGPESLEKSGLYASIAVGNRAVEAAEKKAFIMQSLAEQGKNPEAAEKVREVRENDEASSDKRDETTEKILEGETTPEKMLEKIERNVDVFEAGHVETLRYNRQETLARYELPGQVVELSKYTGHGIPHVKEVIYESKRLLDAYEKAGIEVPDETKLRITALVAARYHDIGMADPGMMEQLNAQHDQYTHLDQIIRSGETTPETVAYLNRLNQELREKNGMDTGLLDTTASNAGFHAVVLRQNLISLQGDTESQMRKDHARNSARYLLEHGADEDFKERFPGADPRICACAVALHTKSNSGCMDTIGTDRGDGPNKNVSVETACRELLEKWNNDHPDQPPYSTEFTKEELDTIAFSASVLRTADNRRDGASTTFMDGNTARLKTEGDGYSVQKIVGDNQPVDAGLTAVGLKIVSAELCTSPEEVRVNENNELVHCFSLMKDADGNLQNIPEQMHAPIITTRLKDYLAEVESGSLRNGANGVTNVIELRVADTEDAEALEKESNMLMANLKDHVKPNDWAKQPELYERISKYAGRIKVVRVSGKGGSSK